MSVDAATSSRGTGKIIANDPRRLRVSTTEDSALGKEGSRDNGFCREVVGLF